MRSGIHPLYVDTVVTCACGATHEVGSTSPNLKIDICSKCHPYYTGTHKIMDTEGRIDRFRSRYAKAASQQPKK